MKNCSVIMVSYHTGPALLLSLKAALAQEGVTELLVVNNGNPPEMLAEIAALAVREPRLTLLSGHGNIGFAAGCNLGAKAAIGEFLLLLNPDCLPAPNTAHALMNALETTLEATLAGPHLLNPDGSEQRGGRRALLTPKTALTEALGLHRFLPMERLNAHDTPLAFAIHQVPAISGACMCIRKSDYEALGGMDEKYFLHVEDLDLCWRVHQRGGRTLCVPEAKVVHLLSTSNASSAFVERHKMRGFARYMRTHFAHSTPLWLMLAVRAGNYARGGLRMAKGLLRTAKRQDRASLQLAALHSVPESATKTSGSNTQPFSLLVTGATSQIGLSLIPHALARGMEVTALSRDASIPFFHPRFRWSQGDLRITEKIPPLAGGSALIHCAPLWLLPEALPALAKMGLKRVVAFGSTSATGKENSSNPEEQEVVQRLLAAETKIAKLCTLHNIQWTILRPTLIYGLGMDANVTRIARMLKRLHYFPLYPPAGGKRQPVHAEDLALAALDILANPATHEKIYALTGGETLTYREMVERISQTLGIFARITDAPWLPRVLDVLGRLVHKSRVNSEIAYRMNQDLIFDIAEARRDFNYQPRAFLSGGKQDIEGLL